MTTTHIHEQPTLEEIRLLLKTHKLRATSSRIAVMMAMHEHKAPMTHEEVMQALSKSATFDKASIWRVLANLSDSGLLIRMDLGDRVWRYELIDACRAIADNHAHFLCEGCGWVSCLPPVSLGINGPLPKSLEGVDLKIRVTGECNTCSNA